MTNPPQRKWWQRKPHTVKESPVAGATLAHYGGRAVYSTTNAAAFAKEGYVENPDVRAAVDILATAVGGVDWRAGRETKGETVDAPDAPILQLLRRPNPSMSGTTMIANLVRWRRIAGEAYLTVVRVRGVPKELWVLRPDRMKIVPGSSAAQPVSHYVYKVSGGKERRLNVEDVLHLPMFNPVDDFHGSSPLASTARLIDQAAAAADMNLGTMQNGGIPPGFLYSDENLTDEQFLQLKDDMKSWGLARNAGLPELLPGGFKWQDAARTPLEMQFLEGSKVAAQKQAQVIGIPAEFLAGAGEKKYSNFGEAQRALWTFAALPELDYLKDELNHWLAPMFNDGVLLDYCDDDIEALQEDREKVYKAASAAFKDGLARRNEARGMIGLEPVEGGDVFVEDTKGFVGFGMPEQKPGEPDEEGDPPGDAVAAKAFNLQGREGRAAYWKLVDDRRASLEETTAKKVAAVFEDERSRVAAAIGAGGVDAIDRALKATAKEWERELAATYQRVGKVFADATLEQLKAQTGPFHVKADGWRSFVEAYVKRTGAAKIQQITDTTRKDVKFVVDQGIEEGLSVPDIAAMVDRLYLDQIIPNRSTVIARTETIAASNAGSMGAAESTGLPLVKEWIATSDDRTRSSHADMDGVQVAMGEPFDVDGDALDFPGDSSHGADASNVIQCRCTQGFQVVDE